MRLFLISSSFYKKGTYLEHCMHALLGFLGARTRTRVLFIPYAVVEEEYENYTAIVSQALKPFGLDIIPIYSFRNPLGALRSPELEVLFVGGGNTFLLLKTLQCKELLQTMRDLRWRDMAYVGSSAGTNLACPTIKTTNDMPIVWPSSLDALNFLPFQINPHYLDADPGSTHRGETREKRIEEFLKVNKDPSYDVIGLREGSWLTSENDRATLCGTTGAVLFKQGEKQRELENGVVIL